jgi:hypothetical protein
MLFLAVSKVILSCGSGYRLEADGAEGEMDSPYIAAVVKSSHKRKRQFSSTDAAYSSHSRPKCHNLCLVQ